MEPIIEIIGPDGSIYPAGVKYARGFDGANAEAREVYKLESWRLEVVGWASNARPERRADYKEYYG